MQLGFWRAEKDRRAPGITGQLHISSGAALKDQIGEVFKPPVPAFDNQNGFAERLVIGDGHMDRIHAPRHASGGRSFPTSWRIAGRRSAAHSGTPAAT